MIIVNNADPKLHLRMNVLIIIIERDQHIHIKSNPKVYKNVDLTISNVFGSSGNIP